MSTESSYIELKGNCNTIRVYLVLISYTLHDLTTLTKSSPRSGAVRVIAGSVNEAETVAAQYIKRQPYNRVPETKLVIHKIQTMHSYVCIDCIAKSLLRQESK